MTVKKSDSLYSIKCYTAQVAVTATPKSETDTSWRCQVQYWSVPMASAIPTPCFYVYQRTAQGLLKLDQSLEPIASLCPGCLLGNFDGWPFRRTAEKAESVCENFTWISKAWWIWRPCENRLYFVVVVDSPSRLTNKSHALKWYRGFADKPWNRTCQKVKVPEMWQCERVSQLSIQGVP